MKNLKEYINDAQLKSGLRNIYYDETLKEELRRIFHNDHSDNRSKGLDDINYGISDNEVGIPNSKIKKIFKIVDDIFLDALELNRLKHSNNKKYDNSFGICLQENRNDKETIMIIG